MNAQFRNPTVLEYLHPRYDDVATSDDLSCTERNPCAGEAELIRSLIQASVASTRADLQQTYGWTQLDIHAAIDNSRRQVLLHGDVVLDQIASMVARRLRLIVAPRWKICVALSSAEKRAPWASLTDPVSRVWREWCGSAVTPSLATEFLQKDGPVRVLARTKAGSLIKGMDGTVGWTTESLDERRAARMPAMSRGKLGQWSAVARSLLGVRYKTGGATQSGLDCSGLTQRVYRDVVGAIIPRHSRNQFAVAANRTTGVFEGQLAFISGPGDAAFHVGVVVRRGRAGWGVVHASSARGEVVEDSFEAYLALGGGRRR